MESRQTTAVLVAIAVVVLVVAASKIGTSRKFQIGTEGFLGLTVKGNRFGVGGEGTVGFNDQTWRPQSFAGTYHFLRPGKINFIDGGDPSGPSKTHQGTFNFQRRK